MLGSEYSISTSEKTFRFSDPLDSGISGTKAQRRRRSFQLYVISVLFLALYSYIVWNYTNISYRHQGLGFSGWIVLLDFTVWLRMRRGTCNWGPGKTVLILALARACIVTFCGELWLGGIGASFFVFGIVLAIDVVIYRFKEMSDYEVGAIAFFGATKTDKEIENGNDVASTPEFVLSFLSFCFLLIIFLTFHVYNTEEIVMPRLQVMNSTWQVYVIAILAFEAVIMVALVGTTTRSIALTSRGLLHSELYFWRKPFGLPYLLAALTYFMACVARTLNPSCE